MVGTGIVAGSGVGGGGVVQNVESQFPVWIQFGTRETPVGVLAYSDELG